MNVGDRFDRYILTDQMAGSEEPGVITWRGRDTVLDRTVLVRLIATSERRSAQAIDAARDAARVDSQFLGRVYDVILVPASSHSPETIAVVMEWLDGTTLADELERGPLASIDQAIALVDALAQGLAAAHREGVCHGRVRAEALVHVPELGYEVRGLAVDAAIFGPLRPDLPPTLQDLDGLGRVAYQALTGQDPPATGTPVPPSWVRADSPAWLDDIVMGCLAPEGQRPRFTSLAQVRERVPGVVSGRRRRRLPRVSLSEVARRLVLTAVAAGVICALLFIGLSLARSGSAIDAATPSPGATSLTDDVDLLVAPVQRQSQSATAQPPSPVDRMTARSFLPTFSVTNNADTQELANAFGDAERDQVIDADIGTCWKSRAYRSPVVSRGDGVGLVVDLGRETDVDGVSVTFGVQGSDVDVRVGDSIAVDPRTWPLLTKAAQGDSVITLRGTEPKRGRFVLLWFPRLPATLTSPERYQVSVCEIRITAS